MSHPRLNEREHERGYRKLPSPAITPRSRHDLRHARATHMLASGIHPKVASERLGHSKAVLRSIFTTTCCRACRKTAAQVDNALQIALQKLGPRPIR